MGHVFCILIPRIKCPHPYTQFKNLYRCWQWAKCRGIWSSWQCGGVTHTMKIETSLYESVCLNIERCAQHVAPSFYYLNFWDKRPMFQCQVWIQNWVGKPTWRRWAPSSVSHRQVKKELKTDHQGQPLKLTTNERKNWKPNTKDNPPNSPPRTTFNPPPRTPPNHH